MRASILVLIVLASCQSIQQTKEFAKRCEYNVFQNGQRVGQWVEWTRDDRQCDQTPDRLRGEYRDVFAILRQEQ